MFGFSIRFSSSFAAFVLRSFAPSAFRPTSSLLRPRLTPAGLSPSRSPWVSGMTFRTGRQTQENKPFTDNSTEFLFLCLFVPRWFKRAVHGEESLPGVMPTCIGTHFNQPLAAAKIFPKEGNSALLVPQRLNGIELGGFDGGNQTGQHAHARAQAKCHEHRLQRDNRSVLRR